MIVDPILPQSRIDDMQRHGWWQNKTLLEYFEAALRERPEAIAVVDLRTATGVKNSLSFAALNDKATRIALALVHYGIGKQDVVSFQLPNWWEFVAVNIACLKIGAVSNPLMPIFRQRELSYMVDFAESKVMIIPSVFRGFDHAAMLTELRPQLPKLQHVFVVGGTGDNNFEQALIDPPWEDQMDADQIFAERAPAANDVIELMYTSGTTGTPKGVMHASNALGFSIRTFIERIHMTDDDVMYMGSPLAHQTGFLYGLWISIAAKTKLVLQDQWQADTAWRLIDEEQATCTMGATPFLADLTHSPVAARHNSKRFRLFICGGAPVPRNLAQEAAERLQIDLMTVWGMTECGVITSTLLDDPPQKTFQTDGIIYPGCALRLVDEHDNEVPPGTEGRVLQQSPSSFLGYLKRPEAYGRYDGDYFDTGDLAKLDHDGYIRITGRSKDIIIRGGENIPIVEIENVLYEHPATIDVAVVAMPDERLGELGCCFITLQPGRRLSFEDMKEFLSERKVAKSYWPEHLEIIAEMPRTASGKIQKFQLREMAKTVRDN